MSTVRVRMRRRKNEVEVLVEDSGPGIEPDALDRIFERFYTDRPEQGFGQNSGLGLSISRQIIEAHRGTIRAENRAGPPDEEGRAHTASAPASSFACPQPARKPQRMRTDVSTDPCNLRRARRGRHPDPWRSRHGKSRSRAS